MVQRMSEKLPRPLRRFARFIEGIKDYRSDGPDGDGFWIHLKPTGYINKAHEVHMIHEDDITQCIPLFDFVEPCRCGECVRLMGADPGNAGDKDSCPLNSLDTHGHNYYGKQGSKSSTIGRT